MAVFEDHIALSKTLYSDFETSLAAGEWPVAVDAGYYAVFHGMEAMSAIECRDSYSFADAADILETALRSQGLSEEFIRDYRYLFYFRRGALYGAHIPTQSQMTEFARRAKSCVIALQRIVDRGVSS